MGGYTVVVVVSLHAYAKRDGADTLTCPIRTILPT